MAVARWRDAASRGNSGEITGRPRLGSLSGWYLAPFVLALPLDTVLRDFQAFQIPIVDAFGIATVAQWCCALVGVLIWIRERRSLDGTARWGRGFLVLIICWLALWLGVSVLDALRGEHYLRATLLLPLCLVLVLFRPISRRAALGLLDLFAGSILTLAIVTYALQRIGLLPFIVLPQDITPYWLPLNDLLGIPSRWLGMLANPNQFGFLCAFTLVYGLGRRGVPGWCIAALSVVCLLTTGSRGGFISAAAGCTVVLLSAPLMARVLGTWRFALGLLIVIVGSAALLARNPTATGRTDIWPDYVQIWLESPLFGVGRFGVLAHVQVEEQMRALDPVLPGWAGNAHNILLDPLTVYGPVGAGLVLVLVVCAGALAVRSARMGAWLPIALLVTFVVDGIIESVPSWSYWSYTTAAFLLVSLLSGSALQSDRGARESVGPSAGDLAA